MTILTKYNVDTPWKKFRSDVTNLLAIAVESQVHSNYTGYICFDFKDEFVKMVVSDGHVMRIVNTDWSTMGAQYAWSEQIMLPAYWMKWMLEALDEDIIYIDSKHDIGINFKRDEVLFGFGVDPYRIPVPAGFKFPDWRHIVQSAEPVHEFSFDPRLAAKAATGIEKPIFHYQGKYRPALITPNDWHPDGDHDTIVIMPIIMAPGE